MEKRDSDKINDFAYRPSIYADVGDFSLNTTVVLLCCVLMLIVLDSIFKLKMKIRWHLCICLNFIHKLDTLEESNCFY